MCFLLRVEAVAIRCQLCAGIAHACVIVERLTIRNWRTSLGVNCVLPIAVGAESSSNRLRSAYSNKSRQRIPRIPRFVWTALVIDHGLAAWAAGSTTKEQKRSVRVIDLFMARVTQRSVRVSYVATSGHRSWKPAPPVCT
mgnify:CR=1 FL=1